MKTVKEKLENLPSINYVSLMQNTYRAEVIEGTLKFAGIERIKRNQFDLFENTIHCFEGPRIHETPNIHKGAISSHLTTIHKWLRETDEPYTLICEDDFSIETVPYWNFDWNDMFDILPSDWECVQLVQIQEVAFREIKLHERGRFDWSVCCYLISRSYAEKLLQKRVKDGKFVIEFTDFIPGVEAVIYEGIGKVYSLPLFVENTNFGSSSKLTEDFNSTEHEMTAKIHRRSHLHVLGWWKNQGIHKTIDFFRL
jgi:hypothetical protein